MKRVFKNKNFNKAKISKKWIYAAAITGVLVTGVQAAKNGGNGDVVAKAAGTQDGTQSKPSVTNSNPTTTENTNKNDTSSGNLVPVTFYNHYHPTDKATLWIDPKNRTSIDVDPNAPAENSKVPNALTGQNVYSFLTTAWHADPKSLPKTISLTDPNQTYEDYHLERPKVINFKDAKNNVIYSQTVNGADDHPMNIGEVLDQFQTKYKYAEADPNKPYVKDRSISNENINNEDNQSFDILVKYKMNIPISGSNQSVEIKSDSSIMTATDFKAKLAEQGYQLVDDDIPENIDFSNPGSYSVKAITNSLPISFVDQHKGVVYSTNLPSSAINQPISIQDILNKVESKGVTPDQNNSIVQNKQVPAFYKDKFVSINVTAPVHKLTIKFIDKSNGNEVVTPLEKDSVTDFESFTIADKVNELKTKNYVPELSALASGFNSQTYDNFSESYVLNPAISVQPDGTHIATVYVDSIEATTANTNKTGKGYPLSFKDANGKPISLTINSVNETMTPKEFQKALADQGYTLSQADVDNLASNSVDLNKSDTGLTISNNSTSNNVHPIYVSYNDTSGKNHTDVVNISSDNPTMSTDDLAKALSNQGYTLTYDQKNQLGQSVNFDSFGSQNPISVTTNAQTVTNHTQTVKIANGDGTFATKTVYIPSSTGQLTASEYFKAMSDQGYTISDPSALSDPLSVASDNIKPVVVPNAIAHSVVINVDGQQKTINVGAQSAYLNKSDFLNAVSAQGYTISDPNSLPSQVQLDTNKVYTAENNNPGGYNFTFYSSDKTKSVTIKHDTPLITKQDLIEQLQQNGFNITDSGQLNDIINLNNPDDTSKVASLIEGFSTYKMTVGVVGSGDTISIDSNNNTISKQDFINRVEQSGYKVMNPDVLGDKLDLTNPSNFNGLIIAKAENVSGDTNNNKDDSNNSESNATYAQDVKVAGSNDVVKVESSNKTMTKDDFVKYLAAKGYKVSDASKLPATIDLTKSINDIELVSNKDESSDKYVQEVKVAGSNADIKIESSNKTMSKEEFVKYLSHKGFKVSNESKLPTTIDLTKSLGDIEVVSIEKYSQDVKIAGSHKVIKVESSKKTMTRSEFIKYLNSKGYKVVDKFKLPEIIDLTKSLDNIKVAANDKADTDASFEYGSSHRRGQSSKKAETNRLPQTGDETNQRSLFGLGLLSTVLGFILAIFGLRKKNK